MTKEEIRFIRNSMNLSQFHVALLFGVTVKNIGDWEKGRYRPQGAALTCYALIRGKDEDILFTLAGIACKKRYASMKEIRALKRLIKKIIKKEEALGFLEIMMHVSNPHLLPQTPKLKELMALLNYTPIMVAPA